MMTQSDTGEHEVVFVEGPFELWGQVKCSSCGRVYQCTPFDDYYLFTTNSDGVCETCMVRKALAKPAPVDVTGTQAEGVCKMGKGSDTCVFLGHNGRSYQCLKGSDIESAIQAKLASGGMIAQGDNCSGPPDFTPKS